MFCGDPLLENHRKITIFGRTFKAVFDQDMHLFMDLCIGFDVKKFAAKIECPEDMALSSFVSQKYGDPAFTLLENIILS